MERMWESVIETAIHKKLVEVIFYMDDDDEISASKCEELKQKFPNQVKDVVRPRNAHVLSDTYNAMYPEATGDVIMISGDDVIFRTQGWDAGIMNIYTQIPDKIGVVYGQDGIQNQKLCTHAFVHRKWFEIVGYCTPPYFTVDWTDNWMSEIAGIIKRSIYVQDLQIEHMHWAHGKSEIDQTAIDNEKRRHHDNNEAKFYTYELFEERMESALRLYKHIQSHKLKHNA